MKNNKTIITACAVIISAVTLTACGSTQAPAAETTVTTTTTAETTTTEVTTTTVPETTTTTETTTTEITQTEVEEEKYPMEECIRKVIKDHTGQEVVSFEETDEYQGIYYIAVLENDEKVAVGSANGKMFTRMFKLGNLTSMDDYKIRDHRDEDLDCDYQLAYIDKKEYYYIH